MPYAKLIINPAAGAGKTARKLPGILSYLKKIGITFDYVLTEAPGHAVELASKAVDNGYGLIVAVGGDGTLNEVVNGLYLNSDSKNVSLGIIGTGTGSDYIRTIGIPLNPEKACNCLLSNQRLTVDLGVVEYQNNGKEVKRLFVNFAGAGFDAEVVRKTTENFKALGSMPAYLAGLLTTFLTFKSKKASLKLDGKESQGRFFAVIVSNGKYGGGKMKVAPEADPCDGLFDVITIKELGKIDLLCSLPRIYKGTHLTHPAVRCSRATKVEINCAEKMSLQADGELLGETPAKFSIIPKVLKIVV